MTIDLDALISSTVTERLDTEFEVTPAGEYVANIGSMPPDGTLKSWFRAYKRKLDGGGEEDAVMVNIPFVINDEALRVRLGRNTLLSRLTIFLDNEVSGGLSVGKGKNVGLGQLRDALRQNDDPAWNFLKLCGAGPVKILTEVQQPKANGPKYSNVTRVVKI